MLKTFTTLPFFLFFLLFFSLCLLLLHAEGFTDKDVAGGSVGYMVKREQRKSLIRTEFGQISAVQISDGPSTGHYYLQFITLEPNSLFLPVLLQAGMVFYVRSGSGRLSWTDEGDLKRMRLKRGDVFRLQPGTVFFVESNLELIEREKLRIYAMFSNTEEEAFEPSIGAYTSISDLVLGFDKKVLASAFKVSEDVIEAITNATKPPAMIHALPKKKTNLWQLEDRFLKAFVISRGSPLQAERNDNKKSFNILDAKPDFKNCNGWSLTVDKKDLKVLKHTNLGIFMVNLTKGSMMGPHWNPMANEIAVVIQGQGMVRVVCPSTTEQSNCKDLKFRVEEGDIFAVPRFHPMAQMSFNNDSFVFMGFSTTTEKNYPQFLAGKNSVLHALNKQIFALSFNVTKATVDQLLSPQRDSVILECTSCAEEEELTMKEEIEKEKEKEKEEEEAKKREEEEEEKRQEEEAKKREEEKERQEEEAKKREEEEEAKKEAQEAAAAAKEREEERREQEEARKREEAAQREQEEEAMRQEEARKRAEEKKREEEAAREREEEKREQEEAAQREQEQEEAQREQEQEEAAQREQAEEARKRAEEKEREEGGEGGGGQGKEKEAIKREKEAATSRKREEEKSEQEAAQKREEAAQREQEEAMKQEEQREREGGGGEQRQRQPY
ncbi:hypothetical protein Ddye_010313 [Dipteronia dyeriana]|uniref:Cupin type-1 domain-containing protein n=1 Tax=Dipteronia dyeriana TaxID=168575 RepID=A0AAD9XDK5_9ROSI|nr:hypothetical protein Ddye_010313 [Dipteronia dyeriana]